MSDEILEARREHEMLDKLYGFSELPTALYPFEGQKQKTWMVVDDTSVETLRKFFDRAVDGAWPALLTAKELTLLWIIDATGQLLVAFEEAVAPLSPLAESLNYPDADQEVSTYLLPRMAPRRVPRLGHGAMVSGKPARVGGELDFDPASMMLYVSNKSGRFGLNRKAEHVENAASRFKALGFNAVPAIAAYGGLR